jgi:hypothetical protein
MRLFETQMAICLSSSPGGSEQSFDLWQLKMRLLLASQLQIPFVVVASG